MLKLDREVENVNVSFSVVYFCLILVIPSLFMKDDDDPLFMESG